MRRGIRLESHLRHFLECNGALFDPFAVIFTRNDYFVTTGEIFTKSLGDIDNELLRYATIESSEPDAAWSLDKPPSFAWHFMPSSKITAFGIVPPWG